MLVDISYNEMKKMGMASEGILAYDSPKVLELYHVNKGPVVFRTRVKKNKDTNLLAIQMDLKQVIQIQSPITDHNSQLKEIKDVLARLELFMRLRR